MSDTSGESSAPLVRLVADLLAQLEGTAVTECEFRAGAHRVVVRRSPMFAGSPQPAVAVAEQVVPDTWEAIAAPLTGMFYLTETPQSPPFVTVGAEISEHQVVGLIESMKMFNPVESDVAGHVRAILVANGSVVEKGQALIYVEPWGDHG